MGDVTTHHAIYTYVRETVSEVRPDEDYAFVRLGNYLTDLSQVRDTLAYAMGKLKIWHALRVGDPDEHETGHWAWTLGQVDVPQYLDDLFGRPQDIETSSLLAQYLERLVRLYSSFTFTHDRAGADRIPEREFLRVFERNFSRYYPHEHLDFPPWPWADPSPDREYDPGSRLLKTLVEQFLYVIEQLGDVQREWTETLDQPRDSTRRHDVLADLGHTIHAVEDFFFHTDVLELEHLLRSFRAFQADLDQPQPFWGNRERTLGFWKDWFRTHALDELAAENGVGARRRFYRRVQDPSKVKGQLSATGSIEAYTHVSTGGFGERDIFHTLYGALVSLGNHPDLQSAIRDRHMKIVLLRDLLIEEERRKLMDKTYRDGEFEKHVKQLADPRTDAEIDLWGHALHFSDGEIADLKAAIDLDRRLTKKYPRGKGLGGFLMGMAAKVQREHETSEARSAELDSRDTVFDGATFNGASAETIGTHSLLSKDTEHSLPFRGRAVSFASFVSSYLARTMALQLGNRQGRLDWKPVVTHFLRYPAVPADAWETQLRLATAQGGRLGYDALVDKPELKVMPAPAPGGLRQPLRPRAKRILEKRYDDEAVSAWREWRDHRE